MDVDNVEHGAGGGNQIPHDHNRDWSDQPCYAEVAAAQDWIERLNRQHEPREPQTLLLRLPRLAPQPKAQGEPKALPRVFPKDLGQTSPWFIRKGARHRSGLPPTLATGVLGGADAENKGGELNQRSEITWNSPHSTQKGYLSYEAALGQAIASYLIPEQ
jgi:hypothetical protein